MYKPNEPRKDWDWTEGTRRVAELECYSQNFEWREEYQVSPDGERIAAVIKLEEESTVCVNRDYWDLRAEKIWNVRFTPDGRLTALVMREDAWTMAVDQQEWPATFTFLWQPLFAPGSSSIAAAVQQDLRYGMVLNGNLWETLYDNANNFTLSPDGSSTMAVVQTVPFSQGDLETYQKGCYSVAIDGNAWDRNFVNVWTPVFNPQATRVAAQVRPTLHTYTIAVDGAAWPETFSCVWEPCFHPQDDSVLAPVRKAKAWGLARDGEIAWKPRFLQLWEVTPVGEKIYAVVATRFGRWTVAVNDRPWQNDRAEALSDLTISPDGSRAAARAMCRRRWTMLVNGQFWDNDYKRIWNPVFSPDSNRVAAKVDLDGSFTVAVDGKLYKDSFDHVWDPVFSPSGDKVLIRAIQGTTYLRIIAPVEDFRGKPL